MTRNVLSRSAFATTLYCTAFTLTTLTAASAAASVPARLKAYNTNVGTDAAGAVPGSIKAKSLSSSSPAAKLDATLTAIAATSVKPGDAGLTQLRTSQPHARFTIKAPSSTPSVLVDLRFSGDTQTAKAALIRLGMTQPSAFRNRMSGWLPTDQLKAAAAIANVTFIHASASHTKVGAVTSQGDFIQHSDLVRASTVVPGLAGTGVTVGVISNSFNCIGIQGVAGDTSDTYADDIASLDLPPDVEVLKEDECYPGEDDEGRAIAQIIHDVAPGAKLIFYTADYGEADFANGILRLAAAGATVIDDDIGYFDEPYFQDGIVSQAIDMVKAGGTINIDINSDGNNADYTIPPVAYFSSAGNDGLYSWEGTFTDSGVATTDLILDDSTIGTEELLNFDPSSATTTVALPFNFPANTEIPFVLEWDQPYIFSDTGALPSNSLDLCLGAPDGSEIFFCAGPTQVGDDPVRTLYVTNYTFDGDTSNYPTGLYIGYNSGLAFPGKVKLSILGDGYETTILEFDTQSPTLQGHPGAAGAAAVGASYFRGNPVCLPAIYPHYALEDFSSSGGDPILFDTNGARLATPIVRPKPDFVASDGVVNTVLGSPIGVRNNALAGCTNPADYPNFSGTSAAAPHAAAVAALLLQAQPTVTPDQIYQALQNTALDDIGRVTDYSATPYTINVIPGFDYDTGYGVIQADAALLQVLPAVTLSAGSLTFSPSAIGVATATQTVTLTNSGGFPLTIASITDAVDFLETNDCPVSPATLAPAAFCTFTISLKPTRDAVFSESIVIATNAPNSPSTIGLAGQGTSPMLSLSPASLTFTSKGQSKSGFTVPQTITVTSTGDSPITITGVATTGEFTQTSNCSMAALAPGETCQIQVTMSTSIDSLRKSGSVVISSDSTLAPTSTASLSGQIVSRDSGSAMPFWLIVPGFVAVLARRRKRG